MAPEFKGGPKSELHETRKTESRLESSLGSRGMSRADLFGRAEIKSMLSDMKGSIGRAVSGFLGRLFGR